MKEVVNVNIGDVLDGLTQAEIKGKEMAEILGTPSVEKVIAFAKKHKPELWKNFTINQMMGAIYKTRVALRVEVKESLKWLNDHKMDLEVLNDLESSLTGISTIEVRKDGWWL